MIKLVTAGFCFFSAYLLIAEAALAKDPATTSSAGVTIDAGKTIDAGITIDSQTDKLVEIEIQKFQFIPAEIEVRAGATVRWVNKEKRQYHSVWFESLDQEETDYFFPEETYERTFNQVGVYQYRCGPHEKMRGVIKVVNAP